jgi:hypothetical protein
MLERMPTMKSVQICNALFAMGKLNLYNAELCDALLQVRGRKVVQCASSFQARRHWSGSRRACVCSAQAGLCVGCFQVAHLSHACGSS